MSEETNLKDITEGQEAVSEDKKSEATGKSSEPSNLEGIISSGDDKLDDFESGEKGSTVAQGNSWTQGESGGVAAVAAAAGVDLTAKVEVFIGGVPLESGEDEVNAALHAAGLGQGLVHTRLIRDKVTHMHKGYGFVGFSSHEAAQKALTHGSQLSLRGREIRIAPSQKKQRIFVGNIPKDIPKSRVQDMLTAHVEGVVGVEMPEDPTNPGYNKGFAFLEFTSHLQAETARKIMSSPAFSTSAGFSTTLTVDWANGSKNEQSNAPGAQEVRSVYVRGVPPNVTEDMVRVAFSDVAGEVDKVVIPTQRPGDTKPKSYCFVHFINRPSADRVVAGGSRMIAGSLCQLSIANPEGRRGGMQNPQQQMMQMQQMQMMQMQQMNPMGMGQGAKGGVQSYYNPAVYGQQYSAAGGYGAQGYDMSAYAAQLQGQGYGYGQQSQGQGGASSYAQGYTSNDSNNQGYGKFQQGQGQGGNQRYRPY